MSGSVMLERISRSFGGVQAVVDATMEWVPGRVSALIGDNGAGKTTLFNLVCGLVTPDTGTITWQGRRLDGKSVAWVASSGVGRLYQDVRAFSKLTALENVMAGFAKHPGLSLARVLLTPRMVRRYEAECATKACDLLAMVGLTEKSDLLAESLSFGEQKLLAIARLLANGSRVLLLDEPSAGVAPVMLDQLAHVIRRLAADGHIVVVIEHDREFVRRIADDVWYMENGSAVPAPNGLVHQAGRGMGHRHADVPARRALLAVGGIHAGFGARKVLLGVDLDIGEGEIVGIRGRNGSGKSTLAKVITGALTPQRGQVTMSGVDITRWTAHRRQRMGLGYLPQACRAFPSMTVKENLEFAFSRRSAEGPSVGEVLDLMQMLKPLMARSARLISGGERQALCCAMVLLTGARLLVLDEPSAGLSPQISSALMEHLSLAMRARNVAALIIEQREGLLERFADRIYDLVEGRPELRDAGEDACPAAAVPVLETKGVRQ